MRAGEGIKTRWKEETVRRLLYTQIKRVLLLLHLTLPRLPPPFLSLVRLCSRFEEHRCSREVTDESALENRYRVR